MSFVATMRSFRSLSHAKGVYRQKQYLIKCLSTTSGIGEQFQLEYLTGEHEGIAVFTMNRPNARNALGKQMMKEFREAIEKVRFDPAIRVVILQSIVPKGE
jgi:1,4-dihydroxy-2-naphthoyl-CoA synthase